MRFLILILSLLFTLNATAAAPLIWESSNYGKFLSLLGFKFNDLKIMRTLTVDPSAGAGIAAPVGSMGFRDNSNVGEVWSKTGTGDTDWKIVRVGLVSLTAEVSGVLPIANGGTNKALTLANGGLIYSDADSFEVSAVGTSGQALISGGAGAPTWYAPTAGSVLFAGTSGVLAQDNAQLFYDDAGDMLGVGITAPVNKLHLDGGTGAATYLQFTNGTTSGQTASDGFIVGMNAADVGQIRMYEPKSIQFATANLQAMLINTAQSVAIQNNTATQLATNAVSGFLYIPSSAGTPTGGPASIAGTVPIEVDTTNNRFYFYSTSAWQSPVMPSSTDTLTNKTIDADGTGNSITNIENADIKAAAAIDASKIADGSVSSTEFQYISTLSSNAQTQIDAQIAEAYFAAKGDLITATANDTPAILSVGTNGHVLTADSGQANGIKWAAAGGLVIDAYTANHTVTAANSVLTGDASSGSFTFTLPTAVGIEGTVYRFKRTDQTLANSITIDGDGTETIDGAANKKLMTQFEEFTLVSDNANWVVLSHTYPKGWASYTPTYTGFGTATASEMYWRRDGDSIVITGNFTTGTTTATEARVSLPSGLTSTAFPNIRAVGTGWWDNVDGGSNISSLAVLSEPSTTYLTFGFRNASSASLTKQLGNALIANTTRMSISGAIVPIVDWE